MFRGLIFDAFETIIEKPVYHDLWRGIAAQAKSAALDPMIVDLDLNAFADACGVPQDPRWGAALDEELRAIRIIPEMVPALRALREAGLPMVVASNLAAPYGPVLQALTAPFGMRLHLSYADGRRKPDPAFLRAAAARVDLRPAEMLMVGNSLRSDKGAADAANMHCLLINDRHGVSRPEAVEILLRLARGDQTVYYPLTSQRRGAT